jgi:transcriptional regulator with XRE-family HTH domain
MAPPQTALGRLLQDRREAAGYSRARIGAAIGIKPGTIEGWELGRVAKPPIHDVLRFAHFLGITADELQAAVFEDAGEVPEAEELPEGKERKKTGPRRRTTGAMPLLETGFRIFGWKDNAAAAAALSTDAEQVRRWRSGADEMAFADVLALASMIGVAAAGALRGNEVPSADLAAAVEALGLAEGR